MNDSNYISTSQPCPSWEALLTDALDGLLMPSDEAAFNAHRSGCAACAELFEEARQGREWLAFLSREPEVPSDLVAKILAHTGPGPQIHAGLTAGNSNVLPMPVPAWQRPGFVGNVRRYAEPRLMMTAAMAFFSIAMTLNMTGIKLSEIRLSDLRPSTILSLPSMVRSVAERRLMMASIPVVRYYDHLNLMYNVQTTVRELQRTTSGADKHNKGEENHPSPQNTNPGESRRSPDHNIENTPWNDQHRDDQRMNDQLEQSDNSTVSASPKRRMPWTV